MNEIMQIAGDQAKAFKVIHTDSLADAHLGVLVEANVTEGTFSWIDKFNSEIRRMDQGRATVDQDRAEITLHSHSIHDFSYAW